MTQYPTGADDALRVLGWYSSDVSGLRLDAAGPRDFRIGRAWSSAGTWDSIQAPGRLTALLVTEGACVVESGTREFRVNDNHVVLLDSAIHTRLTVLTPTVRYLWHFQGAILRNPLMQHGIGTAHPIERSAWLPLTSLSNALLAAKPSMTHSLHTARSIEHLLAAALSTAPQWTPVKPREGSETLTTALTLIEQYRHDPTFTARDVAARLGISDRRLQRAFARYDTTPRRELERQRVQDLRDALSTAPPEALADRRAFALLANAAGFVTSTQARGALRRAEATAGN